MVLGETSFESSLIVGSVVIGFLDFRETLFEELSDLTGPFWGPSALGRTCTAAEISPAKARWIGLLIELVSGFEVEIARAFSGPAGVFTAGR